MYNFDISERDRGSEPWLLHALMMMVYPQFIPVLYFILLGIHRLPKSASASAGVRVSSCKPKLKVLNIWLIWSVYGCVHSESVRFFVRLPSGPRHDRQSLRARWLSRSPGHGCWSERFWCSTAARPKPISTVSQPTSARKFDTLTPGPGPWWVK